MGMPPGTSILPIVTSLSLVAIVDRLTGEIMRTNISSVPSIHEGGGRAVLISQKQNLLSFQLPFWPKYCVLKASFS